MPEVTLVGGPAAGKRQKIGDEQYARRERILVTVQEAQQLPMMYIPVVNAMYMPCEVRRNTATGHESFWLWTHEGKQPTFLELMEVAWVPMKYVGYVGAVTRHTDPEKFYNAPTKPRS